MKKSLAIIALSAAMILTNANVVEASNNIQGDADTTVKSSKVYTKLPDYNGKDVVIIENDSHSNIKPVALYEMQNGKLVKTGDKVKQFGNHYMLFWKADPVKINGKTCWQIGDNLYLKSSRVSQINLQKTQAVGQEIQNFGNSSDDNSTENTDTIKVTNVDGEDVPVMSLQKDGSFDLNSEKTLSNNSTWHSDKVRKYKGEVYCRIATNEWVNATNYVVKN